MHCFPSRPRRGAFLSIALLAFCAVGAFGPGCHDAEEPTTRSDPTGTESLPPASPSRLLEASPEDPTRAFFGDLHVHSAWSLDAYLSDVRVGPEDAYRYARGEPIEHPSGRSIQLSGPPLDFMALTEHGEYLGVSGALLESAEPILDIPILRAIRSDRPTLAKRARAVLQQSYARRRGLPKLIADRVIVPAWERIVELANDHDRPGEFTAFVAYEYTAAPEGQNLHRNVIFRGGDAPKRPFSSMDSGDPADLWRWMDAVRAKDIELLAIPHNANGSNGLMYPRLAADGERFDAEYAALRSRNEPVSEVLQIKGQSEAHPLLSVDDEWAAFELTPWRTHNPGLPSQPEGSYVRDALRTGIEYASREGFNPYEIGMIGSSDGHNAASPVDERSYFGKIGPGDSTPEARLGFKGRTPEGELRPLSPGVSLHWSAAGLAGIWAEENTRAALFDALARRETFATSGPRIRVRFFGGAALEADDLGHELTQRGYARGVPMGGELEADSERAPGFLVAATRDPLEAPIERLQIIKGWTRDGVTHERVFDVACADGSAPDPATHRCPSGARSPTREDCAPDTEAGAAELAGFWRDPDARASEHAFYYARVLQIPTCRWSTWDARRLGVDPPRQVPESIQERAVTSPIWVSPHAPSTMP